MSARPSSPRRGADDRGGISLIEVVIAMVVMAFGVLGLAGTTLYMIREVTVAELSSKRAAAIQSVVERVRAQPFDTITSGADTLGHFAIEWSSTQSGRHVKSIEFITVGPGLVTTAEGPAIHPSRADTLQVRVVRS